MGGNSSRESPDHRENVAAMTFRPRPAAIMPSVINTAEIEDFTAGGDVVRQILQSSKEVNGSVIYHVEFEDRFVQEIPAEQILEYDNAKSALAIFTKRYPEMSASRPGAKQGDKAGFVNTLDAISDGDDLSGEEATRHNLRRRFTRRGQTQIVEHRDYEASGGLSEDDGVTPPRSRTGARHVRSLRSANRSSRFHPSDEEAAARDSLDDDNFTLESDLPGTKKRVRGLQSLRKDTSGFIDDDISYNSRKRHKTATRHSERSTRHQGAMQEVDIDNIYRSRSEDEVEVLAKPKAVGAKETFQTLPQNNDFRMRHNQWCASCDTGTNLAPLIYCQGCILAYHKGCLGHRSTREHIVTKVGEGDFVLQCRRCVAFAQQKDHTAPDQGKCQECHEHGTSCRPFRPRRTPLQEQRERDDNDGVDPVITVDCTKLHNAANIIFRCSTCMRGWHHEHLPPRSDPMSTEMEVDTEQRLHQYNRDWKCKECADMPAKISTLIAWKPIDEGNYANTSTFQDIGEDEKAYLTKWEGMSYFRTCWMPGAWVWGVVPAVTRKAFAKRQDVQRPKLRTEDAIPEDYLRTDIILDIKYTSIVNDHTQKIDTARILDVNKALIKYKGLTYEDACWETPPLHSDGERWNDFVQAYNDWVMGRYVRPSGSSTLKTRLEKARVQPFEKLEKQIQPDIITGGELMRYQIEGLNWLYYKWYTQTNAILGDEMGLGKTIQIIGFLATLVQDWDCFPFLIVVPNSTCPNWRREVKRWTPGLRVVAYYGSKESREAAYKYELYPEGSKDLRCHIVVTSYETAVDEKSRKFFHSVQWQGMIIDEAQRLKNDQSLLYSALGALDVPFKVLMTGTPLQNNQRELFNLLQFLDDSYDAAKLEEEYRDLNREKIAEMHQMIRPYFLRRTKAQVLTFLPPMSQIIVPVSMSIVQKKVYRTILAKKPELMRAIFTTNTAMKKPERAGLNNILMQLRKCLCHPFVYNKGIEERTTDYAVSHRNLVDASSKLRLLELLLPKLQERGHRVLIFSQFLDMLDIVEDFLIGMKMLYHRLDGSLSSLQKQKGIDEFNTPDSPLFAFLLSTRAGGVGINLATADTVIILDPDFNPHQDIQALSRAHRIGQTKKVLCFQLVTRASAEERIMQIGRKKLALDHVLIQEIDGQDADQNDLSSILRHGANELFQDNCEQDIKYDSPSIERLLDRSQVDGPTAGQDTGAKSQWSIARVWANDQNKLHDVVVAVEEKAPNAGSWDRILRERERIASKEAARKEQALGRGRRARGRIDYTVDKAAEDVDVVESSLTKRKVRNVHESDTDFEENESDAASGEDEGETSDFDEMNHKIMEASKGTAGRKQAGKKPRTQPKTPTPLATPRGKKALAIAQRRGLVVPLNPAKLPVKNCASSAKKPMGVTKEQRTVFKYFPPRAKKKVAKPRKNATRSAASTPCKSKSPVRGHKVEEKTLASSLNEPSSDPSKIGTRLAELQGDGSSTATAFPVATDVQDTNREGSSLAHNQDHAQTKQKLVNQGLQSNSPTAVSNNTGHSSTASS